MDLVDSFGLSLVSKSKCTDSEPSLAVIQHFVLAVTIMAVRTRIESTMRMRTQRNHAHNNAELSSVKFS